MTKARREAIKRAVDAYAAVLAYRPLDAHADDLDRIRVSAYEALDEDDKIEAQRLMAEVNPSHNPSDIGLVLLGHLTALEWIAPNGRKGHVRWPLERAPLLAYDGRGRLHIVTGARSTGVAASSAASSSYASTHWGNVGHGALLEGSELRGPFTARDLVGRGTRVTYTTTKGGSRVTDYEHEWGEGARGAWRPPEVMRSGSAFALSGGTYRVTSRGIVG